MENSFEQLQELYERAMAGDLKAMFEFAVNNRERRSNMRKHIASASEEFEIRKKAADQGYAPAYRSVGLFYLWGDGVEKDYLQAAAYLRKALEVGDSSWAHHVKHVIPTLQYECASAFQRDEKGEEYERLSDEMFALLSLLQELK